MRLGLLGGTFDPPHLGHLRLAAAARAQFRLDRVLWIVTADPPHKQGRQISPAADRVAMVEAAIQGEPAYALSRVDLDRPGPHWAADTVALIGEQFPGAQLLYLMGSDSLRDLPTWGRPQELLARCSLGVLRRNANGGDQVDLAALERALPGLGAKVAFIDLPPVAIASQDIRRRVRKGLTTYLALVPPAVARIIQSRRLYR